MALPDFINDFFYLKRKFTEEEKLIIENIIISILVEDKRSSITQSYSGNGDPLGGEHPNISEYIFKEFTFKGQNHGIFFLKSYRQRLKGPKVDDIKMIAYSNTFAEVKSGKISIDSPFDIVLLEE